MHGNKQCKSRLAARSNHPIKSPLLIDMRALVCGAMPAEALGLVLLAEVIVRSIAVGMCVLLYSDRGRPAIRGPRTLRVRLHWRASRTYASYVRTEGRSDETKVSQCEQLRTDVFLGVTLWRTDGKAPKIHTDAR